MTRNEFKGCEKVVSFGCCSVVLDDFLDYYAFELLRKRSSFDKLLSSCRRSYLRWLFVGLVLHTSDINAYLIDNFICLHRTKSIKVSPTVPKEVLTSKKCTKISWQPASKARTILSYLCCMASVQERSLFCKPFSHTLTSTRATLRKRKNRSNST